MQHFVQMNSMLNATQIVTNELRPIDIRTDLRPAPETILVVEDEAFVREATCDILESEGYRVLRARNATEAQTAFRQNHGSVQLLLSDVVLPGQNGPALAKDLQEAHQALPAIFISGWPGVFTLATLLLVASSAPCSAPRAPVAIASTP
jgi:PleD family two-component response regulator